MIPALSPRFAPPAPSRATLRLSGEVRSTIARLDPKAVFLLALNAKANRTGSPVFAGVGLAEKARRRAKGRIAKASRKANR